MTDAWECPCCGGLNDSDAEICACGEGARDERKDTPPVYLEQDGPCLFAILRVVFWVVFVLASAWYIAR